MKRANTRIEKCEIIERLLNVWLRNPDLRLGQLIDNGIPYGVSPDDWDIFFIEDYELIEDTYKVTKPVDDKKFEHAFKACTTETPCSDHLTK